MGLLALINRRITRTDARLRWNPQRLALAIIVLACSPLTVAAHDSADIERIDRVKAAFILNIARFVSWPPTAFDDHPDTLSLCVYRRNLLSRAIDELQGKKVGGRQLQVLHISDLAATERCQILVIAPADLDQFASRDDAGQPLLTIADVSANHGPQTRHHHIMVSLIRSGTHIGFEINLDRARTAGLRLSSQLLKLARIVDDRD